MAILLLLLLEPPAPGRALGEGKSSTIVTALAKATSKAHYY